jgi:hypothetical protein
MPMSVKCLFPSGVLHALLISSSFVFVSIN